MTYKERLEIKHPRMILPNSHCIGCPSDYGFDTTESEGANCRCNGGKGCDYCWDREIDEVEV